MEEICSYLDQLQRAIEGKFKIPLTDIIISNRNELIELIEEIQENVPGEIQESIKIKKEAEKILEEAKKEVKNINNKIQEVKIKKVKENPEVRKITQKATAKLNEARKMENMEIKQTEDFAVSIFNKIELQVQNNLKSVQKAREILKEKVSIKATTGSESNIS